MIKVDLEQAYIIHQRNYKNNSALVDIFSINHGRITLIAKGIKSQKKTKLQLQYFTPLLCSWVGNSDLKTLTHIENNIDVTFSLTEGANLEKHAKVIDTRLFNKGLVGKILYAGFYINELIYYLLKPQDIHTQLYYYYQQCLYQLLSLQTDDIIQLEAILRTFEIQLIDELGYGINWLQTNNDELIEPNSSYTFEEEQGFVLVSQPNVKPAVIYRAKAVVIDNSDSQYYIFLGKDIINIYNRRYDKANLLVAKKLLRPLIAKLLDGKELHSRSLFSNLHKVSSLHRA